MIRVAVIGVGSMGRHHARVIAESPDTELAAIVDPDESADEIAYRHRAVRRRSIEELEERVR